MHKEIQNKEPPPGCFPPQGADVDDIDLNPMAWPICAIFLDAKFLARYNHSPLK
jgi:hypothetical protein